MKKICTLIAMVFCSTAFAQINNGGMENWRTFTAGSSSTLTDPINWSSPDSIVYTVGPSVCPTCTLSPLTFRSDTAHSGLYAAQIMTKYYGGALGYAEGLLTNCNLTFISGHESVSGGTATTSRTDTVTAWIKYVPAGGDSGNVIVQAVVTSPTSGADSVVGNGQDVTISSGNNYILATPAYTMHTYVIAYSSATVVPAHIQVTFRSHITAEHDSSTMYIDDVAMNMPGTSGVQLLHSGGVSCYPNPVDATLHIQTAEHENTTAALYNTLGQQVASQPLTDYITNLYIGDLSTGMYYLHLLDANNKVIYTTKVVKQ